VDWIGLYLEEDLGPGDITANALFPPIHRSRARLVARERAFLSGATHAQEVFRRLGATVTASMNDGRWVEAGDEVLVVEGPTRAVLAGERTALNLVARMSGVATSTRDLAEALQAKGSRAKVAGTRKTTPGFRSFEKEAIRAGGGDPHRMGLFDEGMVKDNHREAAGAGVGHLVRQVKQANPGRIVTCEVESLEDAVEAARAGADWILIDNQEPAVAEAWAQEARQAAIHLRVEVSGGIRPDNLLTYAWADRISMGWLTQKAPAKDFSLEWAGNL
jgi:nicotinate-nucleotide pyrophosphorylase (carboxylating)